MRLCLRVRPRVAPPPPPPRSKKNPGYAYDSRAFIERLLGLGVTWEKFQKNPGIAVTRPSGGGGDGGGSSSSIVVVVVDDDDVISQKSLH